MIMGARQVGKSTLLKTLFPDYPHLTFEPIQDRWQARQDPTLYFNA